MADQDITAAPNPLACEIAAYTEEQLDRYLEQNGRMMSVQDPENISPKFVQRLRNIVQRGATKSGAVDLEQVAAQLQAVPDDREPFSRSPSLATTLPSPSQEEQDLEYLREETESYHALVSAGGRPPYPFHLLEDFLWNPEQYLEHNQYRDIVFFWRDQISNKAERTCFCSCHLSRWRSFNKLQRIIRERSVKSEWTLINAASWNSLEKFVNHYGPMEGLWGFPEYAQNVTRRLDKYGFTRPFQLDKDVDRQDKLTTWIEYLGYEYWFYDRAASFVKRFQRRHDDAWNKLVGSNILRPEETYDIVCNIDTAFQHANERERAEKAVQLATAAISSTERAIAKSHSSATKLRQQLITEQATLKAAKESHASIRTRNDAVTDFLQSIRRYRCEKDEADRYSLLLRWIEQQIPSIELELSSLNSAEDDPYRSRRLQRGQSENVEGQHSQEHTLAVGDKQSDSAQRTPFISPSLIRESHKRRRSSSNDEPLPKRLKSSRQEVVASSPAPNAPTSATVAPTTGTRTTQGPEVGNISPGESLRMLKPLRRSARIAEIAKKAMAVKRPDHLPSVPPKKTRIRTSARRPKKIGTREG